MRALLYSFIFVSFAFSDRIGSREGNNTLFSQKPEVVIFMSSSVPISTWKQYKEEGENFPIRFVLRGLPENGLSGILRISKEIGVDIPLSIDPEEFTKYSVTRAPTIVLRTDTAYDQRIGHYSLNQALRSFAEKGPCQREAKTLLATPNHTGGER